MKTNREIAEIFEDIGFLLEVKGDNPFKIRSYKKAASLIKSLLKPLSEIREKGELKKLEGVGEAISKKIEEILDTGDCNLRRRLIDEFSPEFLILRKVKGIGPQTAKKIYETFGTKDFLSADEEELRKILSKKQFENLKGFLNE